MSKMKAEIFMTFVMILKVSFCEEYREDSFKTMAGCRSGFKLPVTPIATDVVRGRIQCAVTCAQDPACVSVNACLDIFSGQYMCQKLGSASNGLCSSLQAALGCVHLEPADPCLNGGVFNYPLMKCDCPDDFTGTYCERRHRDCSEAYRGGTRASDFRDLYIQPLNSPSEILVNCYLAFDGWTALETNNGNCGFDYNRSWEEYKRGWTTSCSSWLGLENLYYLTNQPGTICTLDCFISLETSSNGQFYYGEFVIGNEASNYSLKYDWTFPHHIDAVGDGLAYGGATKSINGKGFASSDRPDPQGCAVSAGAGWWYGDQCPDTNLHKEITNDNTPTNIAKWPDKNGNLDKVVYLRLQIRVMLSP